MGAVQTWRPQRSSDRQQISYERQRRPPVNSRVSNFDLTTPVGGPAQTDVHDIVELERVVEFIVDDCFFAVGQAIGMRMTVEYDAVIWWHDHFRAKFLAAMSEFGNRWLADRQNVTAVAFMLGERAVRYSEGRTSIDVEAARKAAADVERHCQLHARRASRKNSDDASARIAGYWCTGDGY